MGRSAAVSWPLDKSAFVATKKGPCGPFVSISGWSPLRFALGEAGEAQEAVDLADRSHDHQVIVPVHLVLTGFRVWVGGSVADQQVVTHPEILIDAMAIHEFRRGAAEPEILVMGVSLHHLIVADLANVRAGRANYQFAGAALRAEYHGDKRLLGIGHVLDLNSASEGHTVVGAEDGDLLRRHLSALGPEACRTFLGVELLEITLVTLSRKLIGQAGDSGGAILGRAKMIRQFGCSRYAGWPRFSIVRLLAGIGNDGYGGLGGAAGTVLSGRITTRAHGCRIIGIFSGRPDP